MFIISGRNVVISVKPPVKTAVQPNVAVRKWLITSVHAKNDDDMPETLLAVLSLLAINSLFWH